jgi:DNA-binding NtrC family response regulator
VRIVTATNRDLQELVARGKIREDFFYRINVFPLVVPPLRERGDDVCEIAHSFITIFNQAFGKSISGFSPAALTAIREFHWPGNVRQLENAIKRAFVVAKGDRIELQDLPPELAVPLFPAEASAATQPSAAAPALSSERERILAALAQTGGHKGKAAMLLGYSRITLWKKLTKLGITTVAVSQAYPVQEQGSTP